MASGKRTKLIGENLTISTGSGLAAISTGAAGTLGSIVQVSRVEISQSGSTTLAMCRGAFSKRDTAGTYTMTAATPQPITIGGSASGLTGNTAPVGGTGRSGVASSADSGGTYTDNHVFAFANLNGYLWKPDPEEEIVIPPSTVWIVRFLATPTPTTGWTIAIDIQEMG